MDHEAAIEISVVPENGKACHSSLIRHLRPVLTLLLNIAGRGRFTTALELKEASQLTLSLLYHMAAQRLVKNPLEEENIMGITNYLDLGLQVSSHF